MLFIFDERIVLFYKRKIRETDNVCKILEPRHKKTGFLPMREQRCILRCQLLSVCTRLLLLYNNNNNYYYFVFLHLHFEFK